MSEPLQINLVAVDDATASIQRVADALQGSMSDALDAVADGAYETGEKLDDLYEITARGVRAQEGVSAALVAVAQALVDEKSAAEDAGKESRTFGDTVRDAARLASESLVGMAHGARSALDELGNAISAASAAVGRVLSAAFGVATAGAVALGGALAYGIGQASETQQVVAQLEAVIKSTGGAAGVTAEAAIELANSLQATSTYSDDAILKGENLLLTFTNIGSDVFPMATAAMVDMATAMGTDVSGGAIQLGKALNDPISGVGALSRVGVTFTEEQKKVIEQLVKTGDVAGAQKIILAELNKEFGGSAQAQLQTFAGQWENFKNRMDGVAETIGAAVLPILTNLFEQVITPAVPILEAFANLLATAFEGGDIYAGSMAALGGAIGQVFGSDMQNQVMDFINGFIEGFDSILAFVQSNLPLIQETFSAVFASVLDIGAQLGAFFDDTLKPAFEAIFGPEQMGKATSAQETFTRVMNAIQEGAAGVADFFRDSLLPALKVVINWFVENWPAMRDTAITVFNAVVTVINTVIVPFINNVLIPAFQGAVEFVQDNWPIIQQTIQDVIDFVVQDVLPTIITFLNDTLIPAISTAVTAIQETWQTWSDTLRGIFQTLVDAISTAFTVFHEAFTGDWREFGQELGRIARRTWERVVEIFTGAVASLITATAEIITGVQDTWNNTDWGALATSTLNAIANAIRIGTGIVGRAMHDIVHDAIQAAIDTITGFITGWTGGGGGGSGGGGGGGGGPRPRGPSAGEFLTANTSGGTTYILNLYTDKETAAEAAQSFELMKAWAGGI